MSTAQYEERFKRALQKTNTEYHDQDTRLYDEEGDNLGVLSTQHIPQEFLDNLANARHASTHAPIGDYAHLASIPIAIVNKWHRQGKRLHEAKLPEIIRWLKEEDAEYLMATRRKLV